jgi:hypothetical protein
VLRDFIVGQAKLPDSPFEVSDFSLKEPKQQAIWEERARRAIARADKFIVMLGPCTRRAPGVRKEVAMAATLAKPRFQVIGYKKGTSEWAVSHGGRVYRWRWDTLKELLAPPRRSFAEWYFNG